HNVSTSRYRALSLFMRSTSVSEQDVDRAHGGLLEVAEIASATNDLASRQSASHASFSAGDSLPSSLSSLTRASAGSLNQDSSSARVVLRRVVEAPDKSPRLATKSS